MNAAVGPLSGETTYAVAAFVLSWLVAGLLMRGGRYEPRPFLIASFLLIAVGIVGTFPPFFGLFAQ